MAPARGDAAPRAPPANDALCPTAANLARGRGENEREWRSRAHSRGSRGRDGEVRAQTIQRGQNGKCCLQRRGSRHTVTPTRGAAPPSHRCRPAEYRPAPGPAQTSGGGSAVAAFIRSHGRGTRGGRAPTEPAGGGGGAAGHGRRAAREVVGQRPGRSPSVAASTPAPGAPGGAQL